jgi:hypothetical protein
MSTISEDRAEEIEDYGLYWFGSRIYERCVCQTIEKVREFNAEEMIFFCGEVISHMESRDKAILRLRLIFNRLQDLQEKEKS